MVGKSGNGDNDDDDDSVADDIANDRGGAIIPDATNMIGARLIVMTLLENGDCDEQRYPSACVLRARPFCRTCYERCGWVMVWIECLHIS